MARVGTPHLPPAAPTTTLRLRELDRQVDLPAGSDVSSKPTLHALESTEFSSTPWSQGLAEAAQVLEGLVMKLAVHGLQIDWPVFDSSTPFDPSQPLIGLPLDAVSTQTNPQQKLKVSIPPLAALSRPERIHETAFREGIMKNPRAYIEEFNTLCGAKEFVEALKAKPPRKADCPVFAVDEAKKTYEPYGLGKKPSNDAERDVRMNCNHALHPSATWVARQAFVEHLDFLATLKPDDPRRNVFVTCGGCAAGKGQLSNVVQEAMGTNRDIEFGAVWDAAGEGNAAENAWILQACEERGLSTIFGFAANDPARQYEDVIGRARGSGRVVDPITFASSYVDGTEEMLKFLESDAYKNAKNATCIAMYTGPFDTNSLEDKSLPEYPQAGPLGQDNGFVTAETLRAALEEGRTGKSLMSTLPDIVSAAAKCLEKAADDGQGDVVTSALTSAVKFFHMLETSHG